ncbi:Hypothetical protein BSSP2_I0655 [Brucella suis bv. 2]|nr:Hypothetical protein BSSP3_I0654 [Brucella suis bv. 2]AIB21162.1 Hypothetical protein BSPT1_I1073 [Brucella suis bv. 2]AIB27914.1 Hypothetical protein BSSP1_I1062 [Brucella suis bv. 2]AIB30885.1 Hypothetical protein BSSP2_I0655 [Brucella suis bv. 2]
MRQIYGQTYRRFDAPSQAVFQSLAVTFSAAAPARISAWPISFY